MSSADRRKPLSGAPKGYGNTTNTDDIEITLFAGYYQPNN
jgi:hypothetical protein